MKTLLSAILTISLLSVMAAGITTDFTTQQGGKNWTRNSWKGYDPFPKFSYDAANKCLHVEKPASKHGFGLINWPQRFPAKAGDILIVKYEVKGTGKFFIGVENFSKTKFTGVPAGKTLPLTAQWTKGQTEYKVTDTPKAEPTAMVMPGFGGFSGTELFIKSISFEVKK